MMVFVVQIANSEAWEHDTSVPEAAVDLRHVRLATNMLEASLVPTFAQSCHTIQPASKIMSRSTGLAGGCGRGLPCVRP